MTGFFPDNEFVATLRYRQSSSPTKLAVFNSICAAFFPFSIALRIPVQVNGGRGS